MRLLSTVFLSVGVALFIFVLGSESSIHRDGVPAWFLSLFVPVAIFTIVLMSKYPEDGILPPFAGASAMFAFGSSLTTWVGAIVLVFGVVKFWSIEVDKDIPEDKARSLLVAWVAAAAACFFVPLGLVILSGWIFAERFPTFLPGVCGLVIFCTGVYFSYLLSKNEAKTKSVE